MIASIEFVRNLNSISDALHELEDIRIQTITVLNADETIRTKIRVFDSMATKVGFKLAATLPNLTKQIYKAVQMHNGNVKLINTAQFYTNLTNNFRNTLITTSSIRFFQRN